MITNLEHPKNVAAVYIIADELYYRCDFTYGINKSGNITFKVVMESPDNHKTEHLFIWNELKQKWRCKYPRKLTKTQLHALVKKIIEIDRNNYQFQIVPNPSSGVISISFASMSKKLIQAKVYDLMGRLVYQSAIQFVHNSTLLNLDITKGIYTLELQDEGGNVQRERIVIQ